LTLHESYCLPILTYVSAVVSFSLKQLRDLNVCWNSVDRTVLGFNLWEIVRRFINGLGRLNLISLLNIARVKFYHHFGASDNSTLHELLWYYFADHFNKDRCLNDLFFKKNTAVHFYPRESFREGLWNHRRTFVCPSVCLLPR